MPQKQKRKVRSLFEICVSNIKQNLEFWLQKSSEFEEDEGKNLGPFDQIPSTVLQSLMDGVNIDLEYEGDLDDSSDRDVTRNQILISSLKLFLTNNLESCTLYNYVHFEEECFHNYVNLVANKCKNLKSLKLEDCQSDVKNCQTYKILLPNLSQLRFLEVTDLSIGDEALKLIATYCPELRVLNVRVCPPVTDAGIAALCGISSSEDDTAPRGCKLICNLDISYAKVSDRGIQMALSHLPHLTSLIHESLVSALANLDQMDEHRVDTPKYPLTYLYYRANNTNIRTDIITRGLNYVCLSSVTNLRIDFHCEMNEEGIRHLACLRNLRDLFLCRTPPKEISSLPDSEDPRLSRITFIGSIQPILEAVGQRLDKLAFWSLPVHLKTVAHFCPRLTLIDLKSCTSVASTYFPDVRMFQCLEKIDIRENGEKAISHEDYNILFSSPFLSKICVDTCSDIDDQVFERATAIHSSRHLEELWLHDCPRISRRSINLLMNKENSISCLWLKGCLSVTYEDVDDWDRIIEKENWSIALMVDNLKTIDEFL